MTSGSDPRYGYPRTMKKGLLKGRHFDSRDDYFKALTKAQGGGKASEKKAPHFVLEITDGDTQFRAEGNPRKSEDVDLVLDLLAGLLPGSPKRKR